MSRYDRNLEDYLEEEYLNKNIDKENEKDDIENIINEYFNKEKISAYTSKGNKEYLEFLFQKIMKDDKENNTLKYEQKKNYLDLLKKTYFQKQISSKDKIKYLVFYLKNKYSIITGRILYHFFRNKQNYENNMSEADYKNFILINFNKETINLDNNDDFEKFTLLLKDIMK